MPDHNHADLLAFAPTADLNVECRQCGQTITLTVTLDGLYAWKRGELIQNALPELSDDERELLISQTCGECFDQMFADSDTSEPMGGDFRP